MSLSKKLHGHCRELNIVTCHQKLIFVTGASSAIGLRLLPLLQDAGYATVVLGRKRLMVGANDSWHFLNMTGPVDCFPDIEGSTLIHMASLWLLPGWVEKFHMNGVRRIIAFSSTSRFTKKESVSTYERGVAEKLISAEKQVIANCERLNIAWTIFRPTLIYGVVDSDRNVSDIARLIRRFGVFPLLGDAKGLRQPVNARDLALACCQCLENQKSYNKTYDLSGGETLTYVEMVRRIFQALGRRPLFVHIPLIVFRLVILLVRFHPRFSHLTPSMAQRMQSDLVFDHAEAIKDFGYSPGKFDTDYLARMR